jgi:pimeloyl-ACP methyl ester carboxylesterase
MLDFARDVEGVDKPVCIIWGDRDYLAPIEVVGPYRDLSATMGNLETHIVAGAVHGFMMRSKPTAFHAEAFNLGMTRALAMLRNLRAA